MEEALTESQTKLHEAHKLARIGIWEWITDSDTVYWSDELYEIAGRDRKLPAPAFREQSNLYTRQGWDRLSAAVEQALKTGTSYELELEMIRPDGASRWIKAFGGRKNDGAETALRLYGTVQDITEIKSVELELVESERRYRTLFEEAIDGVVLADLATGEIIECNRAFLELTGYERHELIGTSQAALLPDGDLDSGLSHTFPQYKGGAGLITELATRSGTIKQVEIKGSPIEIASRKIMQAFFRDMTSELRYQSERETSLKLLELMNSGDNTRELIRSLTGYIQDWTGCAAVGVRLREGDDFPYFETRGFPPDFVLAENSLCALDASGRIVRDGAGNPVLECMCGNILRGRFNPGLPFFTPKGSFWTNCTTELLASTSEADRQARTRNRCNGEGYESVALIPLRVGSDTLGLLQINDGRKDRFTPELIHFLENTADQIAMALAQRQARAELRTSEQRFRSVSESIGEFIWEVDTKGQFTFVSDRVESVLGYRPEDLLGKRDCFIADESDAARCRSFRRERMQAKEGFRDFEYLGRTKPGSPVWLSSSGSPILGPKNRLLGFRGATLDITERKLAERSIRLSEEKYRRLFEDAVLGIFRSTVDGKIIEVNPAYARMFGFSSPEETKSQVNDVAIDLYVDPARRNEIVRMVHDAKGPVHAEILYKRKDGSTFTGNLHLWEVRDRSENLYLEGFIEDITERKRAEEEKEKLEAQLLQAQKLEAIGTLAGGIAHDFNNILSPIIGYAQMALDDLPHSNPMRFGQEQIMASGLRAKDLVKQILAFGRPGEGQRKEPVAVSSIVKEAIKLLRASLPSSIKIVHRIENCTAKVDPTQIHQVLMNLCTNAAHAMNNRGILEIRLSNVHLSESDLTGQSIVHLKPGLHLKLSVSDSGSGMDKPTLERIFDPFFTTKAVGKGTGLGLAVVHGIVKHHDGAVTVQSEVGKGSIFNIYIPAVEHGVRMAGETGPSRSGGAERVLLIDDEESIIQMETAMLKGLGYKVTPETNSLHSLEIFRSRPGEFDLVITDQTMPDLTGIELIKEIRRIRADIPMILCTGFSEEVTEETAIALNAEFIMKPFTKAQFAEIIRKVLDAKES
jgi:PAS domain S-box-containing protein